MAQKRMFDNAIINTDKFMDMPLSSKALYFLLGMEADDYGFVSPRRVMKLHNATEDDLKILIAKQYVIYFKSGVVVITDWKKNNWLDKRRVKQTEFTEELKMLETFENKYILKGAKPVLSECLASIEENSIEENSIEESIEHTPQEKLGEFKNIKLTQEELEKLKERGLTDYIEKLSSYVKSTGKRYKSHYATILNWARRDGKENEKEETPPEWFDNELKAEPLTAEEKQELDEIFK